MYGIMNEGKMNGHDFNNQHFWMFSQLMGMSRRKQIGRRHKKKKNFLDNVIDKDSADRFEFQPGFPVTIKLNVCQAKIVIDNDKGFYRLNPFIQILFKNDNVLSKPTYFGSNSPFWDFEHVLKNVKSVDEFFHIKLYRTDEANPDP